LTHSRKRSRKTNQPYLNGVQIGLCVTRRRSVLSRRRFDNGLKLFHKCLPRLERPISPMGRLAGFSAICKGISSNHNGFIIMSVPPRACHNLMPRGNLILLLCCFVPLSPECLSLRLAPRTPVQPWESFLLLAILAWPARLTLHPQPSFSKLPS
jgi:hypothetical protein